jgi:ADP-heptose:LPS heptosyltransferase
MSNILIIKHGSLGDIAQVSGAIQDISENHKEDHVHLLTTKPYFELFKRNPFIKNVILDKRLSRFNLIYLYSLMKTLKKFDFKKIYDLQNSSRTTFYKNILFPKAKLSTWSSSETTLPAEIKKIEFDKNSVLQRFEHQLKTSNIKTTHTTKPDFSWACTDISFIKKFYDLKKYIILFPFCSPHLPHKMWPHYNDLINLIIDNSNKNLKIIVAPGPNELDQVKKINAICILDKDKSLDISQLASLIKDSSFVVANDTGPAHLCAHLNSRGITLFGKHTTAYKVSIERENFKAIQVSDLEKLTANTVFEKIKKNLK